MDNQSAIVDAVLTKKGRELLSKGEQSFKITKFAISDEGVDYTLWNPSHASGSAFYGEEIEKMPVLEAFQDETMTMRHRLVTLPKGTPKMPTVTIKPEAGGSLEFQESITITPATKTYISGFDNGSLGYTAILSNADIAELKVDRLATNQKAAATVPSFLDDSALQKSVVVIGKTFIVTARDVTPYSDRQATITVIGNETGGEAQMVFEVIPPTGSVFQIAG